MWEDWFVSLHNVQVMAYVSGDAKGENEIKRYKVPVDFCEEFFF